MVNKKNNFRQLFRLIFVIFSLYLMGDAFYRWDGFSYYASLHEFLPAVALVFILWSFVAVSASILLWLSFRILNLAFRIIGLKIEFEHLLSYLGFFILFGALAWKGKKIIWPYEQTAIQVKLIIFVSVALLSVLLIWRFRDKAKRWADIVLERITPLVWLFGMIVILAVPLVAYYTWFKSEDKTVPQKINPNISSDKNRPNIILVTFDALAASNMSVYSYHKETTPFISKWAKNATVFTLAESSSNFTTSAVASLMSGKRVWTHQIFQIEGTKLERNSVESLPSLLKNNYYYNIALVVNPAASVKVLGMSDAFDIAPYAAEFSTADSLFEWKFGIADVMLYRVFGDKIRLYNWIIKNDFVLGRVVELISRDISQTNVPPEKAFNRFLELVDNNLPKPFFAWIHIFPPHNPYLPPKPFRGSNSTSEVRTYKNQEELIEESYKYLFQNKRFPEEMQSAVNLMRDYYDEFIIYIDKKFEVFINEAEKRKIENTVIILSADHGESFEHGYFTHGGAFLYEQVTHIPLIIKEPGQMMGQIVDPLVEQIDIPATILDLVDIPAPSWMEGRSLVPLMRGEQPSLRPAFSMNFEENPSLGHQISRGSVAMWEGDYKLIHYLEKEESLLFNLKRDPKEMSNLFNKEQEIAWHMYGLISDGLKDANKKITRDNYGSK
jgi:arylsulfatase A-like enzyme